MKVKLKKLQLKIISRPQDDFKQLLIKYSKLF